MSARLSRIDVLILASLWALWFTTSAQFLIVAPVLPSIAEQWDVPKGDLGSLVSSFAWSVAFFSLVGGPISDRWGRRFVLLIGSACLALALLATGLAWDFFSLNVIRAVTGVGSGLLSGATVAYIGDYFPRERWGMANGVVATGFAAGQILGIPAGTLLAGWDFRVPFVVFGVLALATTVLMYFVVPQPDVELDERLSLRDTMVTYWGFLRNGVTLATVVAYFFLFIGIALFVTYLPMELEVEYGFTKMGVASLFLVGGLASLIVGPFAGSLSDRTGRKVLVVIGSAAVAALMALAPWLIAPWWMAYIYFFVVMVFVAFRVAPFQALVSNLVPPRRRGRLLSLCFAVGRVGFGLGSLIAGWLYLPVGFAVNAALGGLAALAMAVLVALFLPEYRNRAEADPSE